MSLKQTIMERIETHAIGTRIVRERRYRIVLTAAFSLSLNLLYAFYHGALGIVRQSLWFTTMCAYYTILGTMRFSAVLCAHRTRSTSSVDTEYFVRKLSGILLILLSVVLTGVTYLSLSQNIVRKYDKITMITIATYIFYKATMAVIHAVQSRKHPAPLLAVIRTIGCAEAAASVLTLQRSMLVSFGTMGSTDAHRMNLLTGVAVCLFVFVLGIATAARGRKRKEQPVCQNQNL
ncbi:hypothetical protein [Clostridium sp. D33t1_170424_F3]|uniref:hypothetical protein n=1 Tax=Clostridium sp. D33t1_170424_F3 TaxID=2787099 RepID=UPI0018AB1967|nr:hypothetical protein [Clostridium sp. D33t1_170424_F3]